MSRKNVTKPYKIFDAVDISANQTSKIMNVERQDKGSIIIDWTGTTPIGVLTIEARNFNKQKTDEDTNTAFVTLDFGSAINVTGNTGNHIIAFNEMPYTELRLVFTRTSGIGNLTATTTLKVVGA